MIAMINCPNLLKKCSNISSMLCPYSSTFDFDIDMEKIRDQTLLCAYSFMFLTSGLEGPINESLECREETWS